VMEGERADRLKDQPLADLLRQLSQETATLVRQEIELAKAEVTQKGKTAGVGVGIVGAAGVVALLALGALTACLVLALDIVMPAWLAALIVAIVLGGVAAFLGLRGKEKVQEAGAPVPEQTVETVKEDIEWAKNPTKSAER
jgi:predicted phage tail protein